MSWWDLAPIWLPRRSTVRLWREGSGINPCAEPRRTTRGLPQARVYTQGLGSRPETSRGGVTGALHAGSRSPAARRARRRRRRRVRGRACGLGSSSSWPWKPILRLYSTAPRMNAARLYSSSLARARRAPQRACSPACEGGGRAVEVGGRRCRRDAAGGAASGLLRLCGAGPLPYSCTGMTDTVPKYLAQQQGVHCVTGECSAHHIEAHLRSVLMRVW